MNKKRLAAALMALAMLLTCLAPAIAESGSALKIVDLKTQGRTNPVGIDSATPTFSWRMASDATGAAQAAYRIVVTDAQGAVAWDSGEVESAASVGIPYAGEALTPSTAYTWRVTVTDNAGTTVESEEATFVTSLMSDAFDAWEGARWIGANALPLDAASKAIFHINADVTLAEGSDRASFILGADDFRLKNPACNPRRLAGENYVRVELDLSDLTDQGGAKINVYRVGYDPADDGSAPFAVTEPNEELDAALTAANKYAAHHVDIFCTASTLTFTVDGVEVNATPIAVTEMGNTYPNLNHVGFAMEPGQSATFANYQIENGGRFARGVVFAAKTDYAVDGGEAGYLDTFDPSHDGAP